MDTSTLFSLQGRTALVTGGSRGIGKMIAAGFIAQGAKVYISSRKADVCDATADELGPNCISLPQDVSTVAGCQALADTYFEHEKSLDILVNNAGIADSRPMEDFDDDSYERLMSTNLASVFRACRAVLPHMKSQGGGVIVNMGSISAIVSNIPQPQAAYNASKAAVHQLTKSLASDHAKDNIRVNAIAPGYVNTEMTAGGLEDPVMAPIWRQMTPMERAGEVDEIATAALFFCTDALSYCTGSVLFADGGYTTR